MSLQEKYQSLINAAQKGGVRNLQVTQEGRLLHIEGEAPTEAVKKQLWEEYNRIDPSFRSADLILNIELAGGATEEYEVRPGDNLSKIGQNFNVSWKEIWDANRDRIKNPDMIQPGWKLKIPHKA